MQIYVPAKLWDEGTHSVSKVDFDGHYASDTPIGMFERIFKQELEKLGIPFSDHCDRPSPVIVWQYRVPGLTLRSGNSYVADFAYLHQAKNLRIDIEVDETHIEEGPERLHYDGRRNLHFAQRGWAVARLNLSRYGDYSLTKVIENHVNQLREFIQAVESASAEEKREHWHPFHIEAGGDLYYWVSRCKRLPREPVGA